uniref:Uncharacterized protein n=1 Tax=Sphaerodactylus townsendi TaxID=933632 RepID=A0ACB8FHT1_9SAUR
MDGEAIANVTLSLNMYHWPNKHLHRQAYDNKHNLSNMRKIIYKCIKSRSTVYRLIYTVMLYFSMQNYTEDQVAVFFISSYIISALSNVLSAHAALLIDRSSKY